MKIKFNLPILSVHFLVLFYFTISCSNSTPSFPQNQNPSVEKEEKTSSDILINPSNLKAQAIKIEPLINHKINSLVHAVGTLAVPPENQEEVSVYLEGNLSEIHLLPGTKVNKGDILFWVSGPAYIEIQEAYLQSKETLGIIKENFERIKSLHDDSLVSEKEFNSQRAAYKIENARFQGLQKKLVLLDINFDQLTAETIKTKLPIRANQSGFITSIRATKGAFLKPADVVLTLTNTKELHLEIKIFEEDYSKVAVNQEIQFWMQSDTENKYTGKVHLINKQLDDNDRTIEIHGDIVDKNIREMLAPGMYIECDIITNIVDVPSLPSEAIVTINEHYYALKKIAENQFKKVEVQLGKRSPKYIEILNASEFDSGAQFITNGAFQFISE